MELENKVNEKYLGIQSVIAMYTCDSGNNFGGGIPLIGGGSIFTTPGTVKVLDEYNQPLVRLDTPDYHKPYSELQFGRRGNTDIDRSGQESKDIMQHIINLRMGVDL